MRILWAVSSVGKGHLARDLAIVRQLQTMTDVAVDWLAPDPAGDFLSAKGCQVLDCSRQLAGSGKLYQQIFAHCTDEFNLMDYVRAETKLHQHDFQLSARSWEHTAYDVIVGDEAFWLLTGFCSHPSAKPAPFVFITDFIGTKAMRWRVRDILSAWQMNLGLTMTHGGPDAYIYIGDVNEIPAEPMGFLLPGRRKWAQQHCRCVKPIVNFRPEDLADQTAVRKRLGLPENIRIFLAVIGSDGNAAQRNAKIEQVFEVLKHDFADAYFILVGSEAVTHRWIRSHPYLDNLHEYFAASDFVMTQAGYGKAIELSALGIPFMAIPLDYHFEQEYVMAHRLKYHGVGQLITLRNHSPDTIAQYVRQSLNLPTPRVAVDTGAEVGRIILAMVHMGICKKS